MPIKRRRFPKIFPGWGIVLTTGLTRMWVGGYWIYGISAFFKPIATELGITRAELSIAQSISSFERSVWGLVVGWLSDKFGPRWIILMGVVCAAIGLVLMNFVGSLWAFLLVWGVIVGLGGNTVCGIPADKAITNWFVKKRGKALSLQAVLYGLSGPVMLPLIAWLITTQGWRATCLIGGLVFAVIGLPLIWFFVKQHRPEYYGLLPDGATVEEETTDESKIIDRGIKYAAEVKEVEFTLRQAMRTPAYWLLIVVHAVPGLVMSAMGIHVIPFLTDSGIDPLKAAGTMAMMVAISIPFRFIAGFVADRIRIDQLRFLMAGASLIQALGIGLFLANGTEGMIYVWFVLYGIGLGINMAVRPLFIARYFGRKAFGSISGTSTALTSPITLAGPIYVGWIYDTTKSYMTAFIQLAVSLAVASAIMAFVRPPKPPAHITDIREIV